MKQSRQAWLERVLPLSILSLALVAVPVMIFSPAGLSRLEQLKAERERADEEISRLSQEIRELRAEVRAVRTEPEAIERVARDELGLVRKTEVVFHFDE
ncbi:MAG TPA: septum formation initiator family protein [Polyangiaceae bacterium]